ncbi:MAG: indolepyruvate oxidoreductase subunit beta [Actinomycetes bacterium]|nr:indolepyruvate oxidoreductase subunit beta [Actinomycetes bacterium]
MTNVLMVGVGGQGVVLASDILAEAALASGFDVKKSEIHGMSQRGGAVFSHVRYGERVHSPMIPRGEADVLYALERMELLRWAAWARPGATACLLEQDTLPYGVNEYPSGLEEEIDRLFGAAVRIDPHAIRTRISPKVKNTVLLGAVSLFTPGIALDAFQSVIPGLCPDGTADVNLDAFAIGRELAAQQLAAGQIGATDVE